MGDGNPVEIGLPGREIAVGEIRKRHVETDLIQRNPRTGFTVTLGAADFVQAFTGTSRVPNCATAANTLGLSLAALVSGARSTSIAVRASRITIAT